MAQQGLEHRLVISNLKNRIRVLEMQRASNRSPDRSRFFRLKNCEEEILFFLNGMDCDETTETRPIVDFCLMDFWKHIQEASDKLTEENEENE